MFSHLFTDWERMRCIMAHLFPFDVDDVKCTMLETLLVDCVLANRTDGDWPYFKPCSSEGLLKEMTTLRSVNTGTRL
ncbi:hypothetical protein A374_02094 [Fictibacillus macauensis ZFHKF-1]|uniref:Uncharacterized protein n=1 Tax=Fictibacillus macauensis ZFHKF-1 TaxID=1196324 RepID=I8J5E3_9BACL|nr:hypothetical protein A374_02094 [Fictibacillus macauensis ZFHKF-1]